MLLRCLSFFLFAPLLLPPALPAQNSPDNLPLYEYSFSRQIRDKLANGELLIPRAAQQFSYIGRYDEGMRIPNDPELAWGFDSLSAAQRAYFERFRPVDAIPYLLEQAAEAQILILNEAHHKPRHRVFTRRLLRGLYGRGYRYFGLETLMYDSRDTTAMMLDTAMQTRGYPFNSPFSGTYVREPQLAQLIREAIDIGFILFAYEQHRRGDRDYIQASNIYQRILKENPDAKILIHCGWYHLLESEHGGRKWMAQYLRKITGIDPLTVYQDILTERYAMQESPYYRMIDEEKPVVFIDETRKAFNGPPGFDKFDVLLYHPRTHYIYNRPSWMLSIPENKLHHPDHKQIEVSYPCLLFAYDSKESEQAVPVDVIELEHPADPTALVLPPGTYRLLIRSIEGEKQEMMIRVEKKN